MRTNIINRVATSCLALAFGLLSVCMFSSCDLLQFGKDAPEVSLRNPSISSAASQEFISVRYDGEWKLYLVFEDGVEAWARLNVISGSGDRSGVILTCDENTGQEARMLKIIVDVGSKWAECRLVQAGRSGVGGANTYTISEEEIRQSGWLELPDMDDTSLGYYGHGFYMKNKKYRNYCFGWSQNDLISIWVAYPLCTAYTNKMVARLDEWALDPLLGDLSSAPFDGYGGSYVRGHQIPSADRLCCREANRQTFYGTNITPQNYTHNGGVWESLESKIRVIANNSDTTYVVTGVVVSASSSKTVDSNNRRMTVPDGYFKAVLRYSRSSTFGTWNAAAFYIPHTYTGALQQSHMMSVDALEIKTGLDFFVNLSSRLGQTQAEAIEAADPSKNDLWW